MTTGGDYTAWSTSDVAASGTNVWIGNFAYNETYGLYGTGNGNRQSVMTFNHTASSLQTFDIVFDNLGNTGDAGNYSYLQSNINGVDTARQLRRLDSEVLIIFAFSVHVFDCLINTCTKCITAEKIYSLLI